MVATNSVSVHRVARVSEHAERPRGSHHGRTGITEVVLRVRELGVVDEAIEADDDRVDLGIDLEHRRAGWRRHLLGRERSSTRDAGGSELVVDAALTNDEHLALEVDHLQIHGSGVRRAQDLTLHHRTASEQVSK